MCESVCNVDVQEFTCIYLPVWLSRAVAFCLPCHVNVAGSSKCETKLTTHRFLIRVLQLFLFYIKLKRTLFCHFITFFHLVVLVHIFSKHHSHSNGLCFHLKFCIASFSRLTYFCLVYLEFTITVISLS